jgi:hypothetical protein
MLSGARAATTDGPPAKYSPAASSPAPSPVSKSGDAGRWVLPAVAELRKQNQALKSENDSLRKSNNELSARVEDLGRANAEFKQRLEGSVHGMAEERAALEQARLDLERGAGELQTARRQLADSREHSRKALEELERNLAAAVQTQAQLRAERDAARQQRPLWAALAALLAAGLAATAVRRWWPRRITKPFSVSVSPGTWSGAADGLGGKAAFRVQTHWLPGDSSVHAPGGLVRQAEVVAIHGEAA